MKQRTFCAIFLLFGVLPPLVVADSAMTQGLAAEPSQYEGLEKGLQFRPPESVMVSRTPQNTPGARSQLSETYSASLGPSDAPVVNLNGTTPIVQTPKETLVSRLDEDALNQKMVSYLGFIAVRLLSDLEYDLDFGYSEDWSAPRGSTESASFVCEEGGGYDISVTRSDFTKLSGRITAEACGIEGLTLTGTATFEYQDDYWYQDTPLKFHPLVFDVSNLNVRDAANQTFVYSGTASCDWRFNETAHTGSYFFNNGESLYDFGSEYDGQLIYVLESGSRFDQYEDGWQQNGVGLEFNDQGRTGNYPLEYPNCDLNSVTVTHRAQNYRFSGLKYIGEEYGDGFRISTLIRATRQLSGAQPRLVYAASVDTGKVIVSQPYDASPERFSHPVLGQYSFSASAGAPGTYQWASRSQIGSLVYQQTYQADHQYFIYIDRASGSFRANNDFTPWGDTETWSLGVDLDGDDENDQSTGWVVRSYYWSASGCGSRIERYEGLTLFKEFGLDYDGVCRMTNGVYLDASGKIVFSDINGDGQNEIFDEDDDNDGVLDTQDFFPLDSEEWADNDLDGVGDNADTDDDNDGLTDVDEFIEGTDPLVADSDYDGVVDGVDAFPLDAAESVDFDLDGIGNVADTDDDGDGFSDVYELEYDADPLDPADVPLLQGLSPSLLAIITKNKN